MENYRIHNDASVYFVTFSVVEWLPVFVSGDTCGIVADSLRFCHGEKDLRINAYVIMPTRFHAVVFDREHQSERLSQALTEFRKFTGRALADYCGKHMPPLFTEAFRRAADPKRNRRFWQPTRHPVAIHSRDFLDQKVDYLHANPCRKGLVLYPEDWRYSSARFYASGKVEHEEVPITQLPW